MNSKPQESPLSTQSDEPLTSISQLVEELKGSPTNEFVSISKKVRLAVSDVSDYATWSTKKYTRNCLEINDRFELILLCWEPGQKTPIHDHGGEECWVYFVNSKFEEIVYKKDALALKEKRRLAILPGSVTYMTDFMGVHSLQNIGDQRGFSIHLYAKPIKSCNVFNQDSEKFELVEMNYDTHIELT
ncbi:MAG: cysteine dioxygenase family protein [Crocinitomicaceae bacterium]|nr:cysteine dioxygenase family protein [Crocinitomicaceae bacterium]MDG1777227.1 cysteine dioxygenase family protein [Crocinitomicaceae bacterium]